MLIALDYDGTYTEDPDTWLKVVELLQAAGHEVLLVTMRTDEELEDIDPRISEMVPRIVPTHRNAKKPFVEGFEIAIDVWIDDTPAFILLDAQGADKTKTADSLLQAASRHSLLQGLDL